MAVSNSINEQTTGICGFTGTAFTGTAATNHAVIVGGATTSTLTNVGPTATAGQVLQSAGSSADPAFSTATYPLTTTVNQILYSSATNTVTGLATANNGTLITSASGVPSLLANGTTGQVLTATTGSPPSWGAAPSSFTPNSVIQIFDDFIGYNTVSVSGRILSELNWINGGTGFSAVNASVNNRPGVIANAVSGAGNSIDIFAGSSNTTAFPWIVLGGGAIQLNWVFNIAIASAASPRYILRFGLCDTNAGTADFANGVYFEYSDNINSGNWVGKTAAASSRTPLNSSIAVTTGWHNAGITINAAASSVSFTMDGVSLGTAITATIPTAALGAYFTMSDTVGTVAANTMFIDLFYMTQTLTTPR